MPELHLLFKNPLEFNVSERSISLTINKNRFFKESDIIKLYRYYESSSAKIIHKEKLISNFDNVKNIFNEGNGYFPEDKTLYIYLFANWTEILLQMRKGVLLAKKRKR